MAEVIMRIGITYDLRAEYLAAGCSEEETAEFDREDTIVAIEQALKDLGHEVDRIGNVKSLTSRLVAGERWDMVFNIAEGLGGFGREAQVPALLDAYNIPYTFSDPLVLSLTLHKAMAKRVVRQLGISTPDFFVVEKAPDLEKVDLPLPLFAKPVAEGTSKGITAASRITSQSKLVSTCMHLLLTHNQPVLVESLLPGREFTVGILGTGEDAAVLGVMEVILREYAEPDVYSFHNKEQCEELVEYRLATDAKAARAGEIALAVWQGIGCRDAGRVDIRCDVNGIPNFMEVNPLAGLHPQHSDLCIIASMAGMPYRAIIEAIMRSAISRVHVEKYSLGFSACLGR
jgi:D-alanine-D-alanine ligase